jgi:hypothetical protein
LSDPKAFGERLATLEAGHRELLSRINSLESQAAGNFAAIQNKLQGWDKRWAWGLGIAGGILIGSGISLVKLVQIASAVAKLP